jgi:hypothetical protein
MPRRIEHLNMVRLVAEYATGASAKTLATRYHVGRSTILDRLHEAGAPVRRTTEWEEKSIGIAARDVEGFLALIDGVLLGDACVSKRGSLRIEQSAIRLGWLKDVQDALACLGAASKIMRIRRAPRAIKGRAIPAWRGYMLYTPSYAELKEQRARWYPNGTKLVPLDCRMSVITLRAWISGDGTGRSDGTLLLCTDGFSRRDVARLVKLLNETFQVRARLCRSGRSWKIGLFRKDEVLALRSIVDLPKCCAYKLRHARPAQKRGALNETAVREIRSRCASGVKLATLAARYGISRSAVNNVALHKSYRWVQ